MCIRDIRSTESGIPFENTNVKSTGLNFVLLQCSVEFLEHWSDSLLPGVAAVNAGRCAGSIPFVNATHLIHGEIGIIILIASRVVGYDHARIAAQLITWPPWNLPVKVW